MSDAELQTWFTAVDLDRTGDICAKELKDALAMGGLDVHISLASQVRALAAAVAAAAGCVLWLVHAVPPGCPHTAHHCRPGDSHARQGRHRQREL